MTTASYVQASFLGGEKSKLAQGRIDERDYRTWMNVCRNGHPIEGGAWVRRSGSMYASHTRGGLTGRCIKFDFAQATPYTIEFTDGIIRFRVGTQIAFTNDAQTVVGISAANPAVVQTGTHGWATGNTVMFNGLGTGMPLLQNRQFLITVTDGTHFSLQDALTGANIDGSTLGAFPGGAVTVSRIQEVTSPYVTGTWGTLRAVQAETNGVVYDVMLQGTIAPQLLQVTTFPAPGVGAQFSLAGLTFLDGPYLDAFTNGVQATPSAKTGTISLSLVFPTFDATKAYKVGDFVTSAAINYISLADNNVGNAPAGSPSFWATTSAGVAINNGRGFLGTDIGRLVRLFSEPAAWSSATTYAAGNIVAYNPTGLPNASTYWISLVGANTNNIPGNDTTHWALNSNAAIWSWGKIVSLANQISQSAGTLLSNMTNGSAAFDGILAQSSSVAAHQSTVVDFNGLPQFSVRTLSLDSEIGRNYTGVPKQVASATVFPTNDIGLVAQTYNIAPPHGPNFTIVSPLSLTLNLRASASAPGSPSAGTLLGSVGVPLPATAPVVVLSNDTTTSWNFVWIEMVASITVQVQVNYTSQAQVILTDATAEVEFFSPPGTGAGNAVNVEILGPPLLYTTPVITWRLGAYSGTTGFPTCGAYDGGRIWLAGAIDNRFDASVSNGLVGTTLNFAPTDQNGVVGAANAITGVVNSDGANPIFWLNPDLQGIIMGTQAGEYLIFAPGQGPISAANVDAKRVTRIGCANVEPRKTDHTNVFVQRYSRKVMEYFTDVYSGKFAAPNLAKDAMHLTKPGVAELAFQSAVVPIIWGRNTDGTLWGVTYKRDTLATSQGPSINAWHPHTLGSGRSVQSICVGPSVGGNLDALTMVTLDAATGINHVEVLTDVVDEGNTLIQATYLDDAVNPTSVISSGVTPAPYGGLTLNGLWHLNGKTVQVWAGGLDCGLQENNSIVDFTVTNGSITIPYGDGISAGTAKGLFTATFAAGLTLSQILVGFTFTSQGQLVRPATMAESGARNGPAQGKKRRNHKITAMLEGTGVGISFGTDFAKVDPAKFRLANGVPFTINQQFSGIYKDTLQDGYSLDGMLCWQVTRPYPANIANIGGFIETTDE